MLQCKNGYNAGMVNLRKPTRLTIWIACFAILLNALAPSISYAMSARNGQSSSWIEICTVGGTKFIAPASDSASDTAPSSDSIDHQSGHCPFCLSHAGTFALPPPSATPLAISVGHDLFPFLFYRSPQPLFSWTAANPRAPPVAS
ncbi:MAG: DUF2946 domain-containing protein [Oxalobacteraceae bacterium]